MLKCGKGGRQNSANPACIGSVFAHISDGDQSEPDLSDSAINFLAAPFFAALPAMR
jgi:hypothetical protein